MFGVSPSATSDPNQPNGPIDDIIVVTVGDDSPAEQAGIVPSTEIVSVNELSVTERLAEIQDWYVGTFSTDEKRLANGSQIQLRFPIGNEVTLGYRLPDATETTNGTFAVDQYQIGTAPTPTPNQTIGYQPESGYTVIRIEDYDADFAA
jgi:C-terminal processing protease CtpA/Prc